MWVSIVIHVPLSVLYSDNHVISVFLSTLIILSFVYKMEDRFCRNI